VCVHVCVCVCVSFSTIVRFLNDIQSLSLSLEMVWITSLSHTNTHTLSLTHTHSLSLWLSLSLARARSFSPSPSLGPSPLAPPRCPSCTLILGTDHICNTNGRLRAHIPRRWGRAFGGLCHQQKSPSRCVAVCCSVLQCIAVCCSVSQCVAVCCSVLQCVVVCCSVLHFVAVHSHQQTSPPRFLCLCLYYFTCVALTIRVKALPRYAARIPTTTI